MKKTYQEQREFAQDCNEGDYFARYTDDGLDQGSDPGSRCGYSDPELDQVERWLHERGLALETDDVGLRVIGY